MVLALFSGIYNAALSPPSWRVLVLIAGLLLLYRKIKPSHVSLEVPGPLRMPFLGISSFITGNLDYLPSAIDEMSSKFRRTWGGPVPSLGGFSGAFLFVVDEICVRYILQDQFENYVKGEMFQKVWKELLGDGIFAADGKQWKIHRKIASNMFSRNLLRHSGHVTESKLAQVVQLFYKQLSDVSFIDIDLQDIFFRVTLDSFVATAFGVELDSVNGKTQHSFALAFDEVQSLCRRRYQDPLFELSRWSGLCQRERLIKSNVAVIDKFAYHVIKSKRRSATDGAGLGADLISRFFEKSYLHGAEEPSIKDLRDIVLNFIIAGRDTTACALSWTFYELTRHPEVVSKIITEVEEICGVEPKVDYSYETLSKLEYTHAVTMEVLRLHPSVPSDMKYAVHDDVLPDGTFVPARAAVVYSPYALGRSKQIWGFDADKFVPERFMKNHEPSAFKFVAFNAGPRICLGKPLALMNMKMAVAVLLPKFTFQDFEGHSGEYDLSLVLRMKNGFPVRVFQRVNA